MDNPLAIALRESRSPADLYGRAFRHFHTLFRSRPKADVSRIWLLSHLPDEVCRDWGALGWSATGALIAMVAHQLEGHMAELAMMVSAENVEEIRVCVASWPPELIARLDSIILVQGAICGAHLQASEIVRMRVLEWERNGDDRDKKYKHWLRALARAALVLQGKAKPSLDDPFLYEVKQKAVEQLRPVVLRLRKKFAECNRMPKDEDIVKAFDEEAKNPDLPFLSDTHNRDLWARFYRKAPVTFLHFSPEKLFDSYVAFVTKHRLFDKDHDVNPEYVRKIISSFSLK